MDLFLFHPKIVHLPIALAVLMPFVSAGLLVAWLTGKLPRRTWIVAVALQAVLVGSSWLAMNTGEREEERVEQVVAEAAIEAHEEAAEIFTWATAGVLLLFVGGALLPFEGAARGAAAGATVATLLVLGLGYRVGEAGGALVYRHNAGAAYANGQAGGAEGGAIGAGGNEGGGVLLGGGGGDDDGDDD